MNHVKLWLFGALFVVSGLACNGVTSQPVIQTPDSSAVKVLLFKRGVNVSSWLAPFWLQPYKLEGVTLEELQRLKSTGIDHIRLLVEPVSFMGTDGAFGVPSGGQDYTKLFDAALERVRQSGLNVIVDLHPDDEYPGRKGETFKNVILCGGEPLERYKRFVGSMALKLKDKFSFAALELLNEPHNPTDDGGQACTGGFDWQPIGAALYNAARAVAPKLTLVVTKDGWSGINQIDTLKVLPNAQNPDPLLVYTVHYYGTLEFTHQGAGWVELPVYKFINNIPYPSTNSSLEKAWVGIQKDLADSPKLTAADRDPNLTDSVASKIRTNLGCYFGTPLPNTGLDWCAGRPFDEAYQKRYLADVTAWAIKNKVPPANILLGEFGVQGHFYDTNDEYRPDKQYPGAPADSRARWIADIRKDSEEIGIGWSFFLYRGGGFSMTLDHDGDKRDLDPAVVEALGLKMP